MAVLNLKQISDKLNEEFAGDERRLIFWFDAKAEFVDDIDALELNNAKILHLELHEQLRMKYFLECGDTETNYLIYAPFAKPPVQENHLSDMIFYSKEFHTDKASVVASDLGIDERFKPVIEHYIKFFGEKTRTQKFYELEIDHFNKATIEVALMSILCRNKSVSFEEVVRCVLTDDKPEDNKYLAEFARYDLLQSFWQMVEEQFGYVDADPTLQRFIMTLFATYASRTISTEMPKAWEPFISFKAGNIITFLDNLMNNILYSDNYDDLSAQAFDSLGAADQLRKMPVDSLVSCCVFRGIDDVIISWIRERLEAEDTDTRLGGKSIPEVCVLRRKMHFGSEFRNRYFVLENAYWLVQPEKYQPLTGIKAVVKQYTDKNYTIDRRYRYFYYYFDKLDNNSEFDDLRQLVENIYTNDYLNAQCVNWNQNFVAADGDTGLPHQLNFYNDFVRSNKERTVVIISDAMRYEVGRSLFEKLQADAKCTASISAMQSVLPSYTKFGMAALLPHNTIEVLPDSRTLADGKPTDDIKQREAVLQAANPDSRCVKYDDIKSMNVSALRDVFTGQNVVYVYHDQIDARGDHASTENEVFNACEEAVEEIYFLVRKLTSSANTIHYIITADHGFIYKRDKLSESDKISGIPDADRRYALTDRDVQGEGVASLPFSSIIGADDSRRVYFPMGSDLFKKPGSGLNYTHGGSSPQEMIIPLIDVRTEKGRCETTNAEIRFISLTRKITNLVTVLDFMQTEPVSDVVKETRYHVYFVDEKGNRISNECIYIADKKDADTSKRIFKLRFSFRNIKYDINKKYYLVAFEEKTSLEVLRHEMMIDIAFADDFGF